MSLCFLVKASLVNQKQTNILRDEDEKAFHDKTSIVITIEPILSWPALPKTSKYNFCINYELIMTTKI